MNRMNRSNQPRNGNEANNRIIASVGATPDAGRTLQRLLQYIGHYRLALAGSVILSLLSNLLALVSPKISGMAIDAISAASGVQFPEVSRYVLWMLLVAALSAILSWSLSVLMISTSRKVTHRMRRDLFNHLTQLPISFFHTHQTGDVLSILSYDIDTVGASISTDIPQIMTSLITVIGSFSMMLTISKKLLLVFLFTIPMSILFTKIRAKLVRPLFRARSKALGILNGYSEETVSGLKTIAAYHQQRKFSDRFDGHNEFSAKATWKADCTSCITGPTVTFINNVSLALISVFGSLMYMAGGITLGGVSSFILYSRKFSGPINEFANLISELQSALAATERVLSLCDLEPEKPDAPDAITLESCCGEIVFDHVNFGYDDEKQVLFDVSFTAEPGKMIAIVGETGCGKTTLINLMMRFFDTQGGTIRLDGHDIRSIQRDSLRRQFTMVLQDTWLFEGTVAENIAYGAENVTREKIIEAAKAAHVHDMILSLPNGYDTLITESGGSISKGQKQLLTIARAMLMNSQILILDEATSNVDTQTELYIQDAMHSLMRDKTCIVIAHRLSTIIGADRILMMDKGHIIEQGTHKELLERGGLYTELYNAQFDRVTA